MNQIFTTALLLSMSLLAVACSPSRPRPLMQSATQSATQATAGATVTSRRFTYQHALSPVLKMNVPRAAHTATLLADGRVLLAGGFRAAGTREIPIASAEIYDPVTNTFIPTGDMNESRTGHTATLLPNGNVLIAGGWNEGGRTATAELYNPHTDRFSRAGALMSPRAGHTATRLDSGKVLIAGGESARRAPQLTAEIYDPTTGRFSPSGSLNVGRLAHTATLLQDGRVLFVGGNPSDGEPVNSVEIYDPASGEFKPTGSLSVVRHKHAAVLLNDGNVLVIGGSDGRDWQGQYASVELYDVKLGAFRTIADLNGKRFKLSDAVVLLRDGNVLVAGGNRQVETFDAALGRFTARQRLDDDYFSTTLTLLEDGRVLIAGGYDPSIQPTHHAWIFR